MKYKIIVDKRAELHSNWIIIKVGLSPSKKNLFYLLQSRPFKNDEKCFLFRLESSFGCQDI